LLGFPLCSSPALHQTQCGASVVAFVVESFLPKVGLSELGSQGTPRKPINIIQTYFVRFNARNPTSTTQHWKKISSQFDIKQPLYACAQ